MFRFEDPQYLYLLVIIPVLALVRLISVQRQKSNLRTFGDPQLLAGLMPEVSRWRPLVKFCILEAALALVIVMMARPQMGIGTRTEKRVGIETIIVMDISNSMLAEDVAPNRLSRSKMMVENMIERFTDDKVGLIVFAGESFVQLPITNDFVSAKMFLSTITPSMIETQGTDIRGAIDMATHSFTQQEGVGKAIIVITDGEDHEGGAVEAAEEAKRRGMNVYVLGVGSASGAPIPMPGRGNDYIRDNTGTVVMSALNEGMCKEIALAGGGAYIHVENNSNAQKLLDNELDKLAKSEMDTTSYSELNEQFQIFGIIVLLLLILEVCILDRKNPLFKGIRLFDVKKSGERGRSAKRAGRDAAGTAKAVMLLSLMTAGGTACAQTDRGYVRSGNMKYVQEKYPEAEVDYRKSLEKNAKNAQAAFNLGDALLRQNKDSAAVEQFQTAASLETNPYRKAQSYHNIGVVCQSHKMYGEAIEAYKSALRLNPNDDETRYNLALCKKQQQQQQQNDDGQGQGNDDKDSEDKDQQQQQQQQDQQDQQQQQQQQNENDMSKENAEQLLNAAVQQEKNTQEKMNKEAAQGAKRRLEKNW